MLWSMMYVVGRMMWRGLCCVLSATPTIVSRAAPAMVFVSYRMRRHGRHRSASVGIIFGADIRSAVNVI